MNIFEYMDRKRNEYERLRDESQIQYITNQNCKEKISAQIEEMMEEEKNPSQFFLPEASENYKEEIEKLQMKLKELESEEDILKKKIALCEDEIYLLDTLELPDFSPVEQDVAEWMPMRVPEEEFQEKNVSRETKLSEEAKQNVSRETMGTEESILDKDRVKEKICFCRKISELDPRRCGLLLDEIIKELS